MYVVEILEDLTFEGRKFLKGEIVMIETVDESKMKILKKYNLKVILK